jgi:Tol biopolymer transport system component
MRRQDSIKLKQVSEQQVHLEQKSVEAERESQEYLMEKRQAEIAALEALKQKEEAVSATKVLSEQKTQAELTAQEALQEKSKFQENLQQITIQKQLAEKNAIQEAQQRTAAEKEREEVFKRRMQNMGQTLAVKSLQSNNSTLKGLLALHSYVFNTKFGNSMVNPDVYNALFTAVKDAKGTTQYGLKGHAGTVRAFALQPRSNVLYSTGVDGKVLRWVVTDDVRPPQTVFQATGGNSSMVISNNGRYLAVGSESGNIYLLNLSSPGAPVTLRGHQGAVFSMAFTPDGQQLISSGSDKKIFLWDIENNSKTPIYQEPVSVRAISISPDGKFLAGGSDNGRIFLWDIKGNQFADLPSEDNTPIHSIAFSPNGLTLVTGDLSGRVKFWNPYSHKLVRVLQPHTGRVTQIVFSSSGEMVASSSYDKSVAIFDTKFISTVPLVIKENSLVFSLIFTNDSKRLITALNSADFVNVWPAQARILAEQLCSKVTRALTQDEWNSFIGSDIKYEKPCE